MQYFAPYLSIISLAAILLTVWDKYAARKRYSRVPERTLLLVSLLGGSLAMLVTMHTIRHKTQHARFMVGIPVILALQVLGIIGYLYWQGSSPF